MAVLLQHLRIRVFAYYCPSRINRFLRHPALRLWPNLLAKDVCTQRAFYELFPNTIQTTVSNALENPLTGVSGVVLEYCWCFHVVFFSLQVFGSYNMLFLSSLKTHIPLREI